MQKVEIYNKEILTIAEAAELFHIGQKKIRQLTSEPNCSFVLWVGNRRLIKKDRFKKFLDEKMEI